MAVEIAENLPPDERGWETARQRWATHCPNVDKLLEAFASELDAEYPSGEVYPDARVIRWRERHDPIEYTISMLLHQTKGEGETVLRVFAQTWIDDETKGIRRSVTPYHIDLQTPVRPRVLEGALDGLLGDLIHSSPALIRQTAENVSIPIVEHPLPKLPGQS